MILGSTSKFYGDFFVKAGKKNAPKIEAILGAFLNLDPINCYIVVLDHIKLLGFS